MVKEAHVLEVTDIKTKNNVDVESNAEKPVASQEFIVLKQTLSHLAIKAGQVWNITDNYHQVGYKSVVILSVDNLSQIAQVLNVYDETINESYYNVDIVITGKKNQMKGKVNCIRSNWIPFYKLMFVTGRITDECYENILRKISGSLKISVSATKRYEAEIKELRDSLAEKDKLIRSQEKHLFEYEHTIDNNDEQIKNLKTQLQRYKTMSSNRLNKLNQIEENDAIRENTDTTGYKMKVLKEQVEKLKNSLQERDNDVKARDTKIASLENELQSCKEKFDSLETEALEALDEANEKNRKIEELESSLHNRDIVKKSAVRALEETLEKLEKVIESRDNLKMKYMRQCRVVKRLEKNQGGVDSREESEQVEQLKAENVKLETQVQLLKEILSSKIK